MRKTKRDRHNNDRTSTRHLSPHSVRPPVGYLRCGTASTLQSARQVRLLELYSYRSLPRVMTQCTNMSTLYPAKLHASKVAAELKRLCGDQRQDEVRRSSSLLPTNSFKSLIFQTHVVYLQAAPVMQRHDTDRELPYRAYTTRRRQAQQLKFCGS